MYGCVGGRDNRDSDNEIEDIKKEIIYEERDTVSQKK